MTSFLQAAVSGSRVQLARRPINTFEILRFCEKQVNKIFRTEEHELNFYLQAYWITIRQLQAELWGNQDK
jgi:hypothetical protein